MPVDTFLSNFQTDTVNIHVLTSFMIRLNEYKPSVPDERSRILEVVVVRCLLTWVLGIWSGEGMARVEQRGGQFTSNLRPRWMDPVTERRVSK